MPLFGPYYYGKQKWDNYLLDIQHAINAETEAIQSATATHAQIAQVQQETLVELHGQTLQLRNIQETLESGFEALRSEFEWGFSLLAGRMDRQITELIRISTILGDIRQAVVTPLGTATNELFREGEDCYKKGLYNKALKHFLEAEQKNDVDFVLQLQIGKLYLFGCYNDFHGNLVNLIDLKEAETHLLLAASYAHAEKQTISAWARYCGEAYFHAALAAYLLGEQAHAAGNHNEMSACLRRAIEYLTKGAKFWPTFADILYTLAKCHAILGQFQDALKQFEFLSDWDRRYFEKAMQDGDFHSLRNEIRELFERALTSPGPRARATRASLDSFHETLVWVERAMPQIEEDTARIESIRSHLAGAHKVLPTLHADIESLSSSLAEMQTQLQEITLRSLQGHIKASQDGIRSTENRAWSCGHSIEELKKKMENDVSGAGVGCLVALLAFFVGPILLLPTLKGQKTELGALYVAGFFVAIPAAIIAAAMRRAYKKRPYKQQISLLMQEITQCNQMNYMYRQQEQQWSQEMTNFLAWKAKRISLTRLA
jgi:tetratricopeptide (TPR) repeat protein